MTARNSHQEPAPSIRAASYSSFGIFCTPASSITRTSPYSTQVPISPTVGSAKVKSPSQGRTSPPRPTASSALFSGPSGASSQRQITAIAVGATTYGRNSTAR